MTAGGWFHPGAVACWRTAVGAHDDLADGVDLIGSHLDGDRTGLIEGLVELLCRDPCNENPFW
jgi:hypothetical protein